LEEERVDKSQQNGSNESAPETPAETETVHKRGGEGKDDGVDYGVEQAKGQKN
jgi:hypothetical protein